MTKILHIKPEDFLVDSFRLGKKIYLSGFRPKHAISIWRGGTPVGLGVDTYFKLQGVNLHHSTIATSSYTGLAQSEHHVLVKNLEHLVEAICPEDGLLIIDDVYESGSTIQKIVELLRRHARANAPEQIVVGTVHKKPKKVIYNELPIISLRDIDSDVWIDYPHELADLVLENDPEDHLIREKDEEIWNILRSKPCEPVEIKSLNNAYYVSPRELLLDCIRLGVQIARDNTFRPDFMIALWPGGIMSGLPVHEVYKYFLKREHSTQQAPDHISINTLPTRQSFNSQIIGLRYLEDRINRDDNILIIDTTFRAGRLVNDVVIRLKEVLRRNLNHKRIRVASVYYNPDDRSTWTVRPDIKKPNYYLKIVRQEIIYPSSVHKLAYPQRDLKSINLPLWNVLFGEDND